MNIKNLYSDIVPHLPPVIKNRGARAIDSNDMAKTRYADMDIYENEKLWLLQLMKV
jgi:hypothetical protein